MVNYAMIVCKTGVLAGRVLEKDNFNSICKCMQGNYLEPINSHVPTLFNSEAHVSICIGSSTCTKEQFNLSNKWAPDGWLCVFLPLWVHFRPREIQRA